MGLSSFGAPGSISRAPRTSAAGRFSNRLAIFARSYCIGSRRGRKRRDRTLSAAASARCATTGATGGAKETAERARGDQYPTRAGFYEFSGRPGASPNGAGAGSQPRRTPARRRAGPAISGVDVCGISGIVPIAGGPTGTGKSGRDRVSRSFLSFLRAIFFSVYYLCGSYAWNATLRAYHREAGRQLA